MESELKGRGLDVYTSTPPSFAGGPVKLQLPRGSYMTPQGAVFEARRLVRINQSWAVILPRLWVELFARERWVEVTIDNQTPEIRIRPLSQSKLEAIHEWNQRRKGNR